MYKSFKEINENSVYYVVNIQNGINVDDNFNNLLVEFEPIINKVVNSVKHNHCIEKEDLEQEAIIALWKCCYNYDFNSKNLFYTYFYGCAFNALTLYVYKFQTPMTITKYEKVQTKELNTFAKEYHQANGEFPSVQDYVSFGFDKKTSQRFCRYITDMNLPAILYDEIECESDSRTIEEEYELKEISEHIRNAVKELPNTEKEPYKEVIELSFFEELTNVEIAKRLGKCEASVRNYKDRALQQLKERLQDCE